MYQDYKRSHKCAFIGLSTHSSPSSIAARRGQLADSTPPKPLQGRAAPHTVVVFTPVCAQSSPTDTRLGPELPMWLAEVRLLAAQSGSGVEWGGGGRFNF